MKKIAFSYDKLWKLLIDKKMNKVTLCKATGIAGSTMSKITKGQSVNMEALAKICKELDCNIGDIVGYIPEDL